MKIRTLLLVAALLFASAPVANAAPSSRLPLIELGFGPSSLVPLGQGSPIYTIGDQLWLSSDYNLSLSAALFPSGSSIPVSVVPISYKDVELVYTFGPNDQSGVWSLVLVSGTLPFQVIQVYFERPPDLTPPVLSSSSLLSNGTLLSNFTMNLGEGYNGEGCIVGSVTPSAVQFSFPSSDGDGEVTLTTNGSAISVLSAPLGIHGGQSNSMDFWVELYYPYSYTSSANPESIVTRDILVARSNPSLLNSSLLSNSTIELSEYSHLRTGTYDLVAYFRDSSGLTARESSVLWSGTGPWVWLGGCVSLKQLASSFYCSTSLALPSTSWPFGIYAMLADGGVEGVGFSPISLNLTRVALHVEPYGGNLPGAVVISVNGPDISNYTYYDGSLYLVLDKVPSQVDVSVGYPGVQSDRFTIPIASGRNSTSLGIPFGQVSIAATSNGLGFSNAEVLVNSTLGSRPNVAAEVTSGAGTAFFSLLSGNYTVTLRSGGFAETEDVQVVPGSNATLGFDVPYSPNLTLPYLLLGLATLGVLVNVLIWRRVVRSA